MDGISRSEGPPQSAAPACRTGRDQSATKRGGLELCDGLFFRLPAQSVQDFSDASFDRCLEADPRPFAAPRAAGGIEKGKKSSGHFFRFCAEPQNPPPKNLLLPSVFF